METNIKWRILLTDGAGYFGLYREKCPAVLTNNEFEILHPALA